MLEISEVDLLDGTPVLDIKPYIPAADAFPTARAGWVDAQVREAWTVEASPAFEVQAAFVRDHGGLDVLSTACVQLAQAPFDSSRKRVVRNTETSGTLSLRMFRLDFTVDEANRKVLLQVLRSGYSADDLDCADDPYADKDLHRAFCRSF